MLGWLADAAFVVPGTVLALAMILVYLPPLPGIDLAAYADELATRAGIHVPDDGPYETLAGLVMTELGRIPQLGDRVTAGEAELLVDAMEGRRVTRLRVIPIIDAQPDDAADRQGRRTGEEHR